MRDKVSQVTLSLAKAYTDEHGGGGGGTSDYNDLSHLPTFNGKTWKGTLTSSDVGLGELAEKDSASGTLTPEGTVTISEENDTTTSVSLVTQTGTSPSFSVEDEVLIFDAGALPTVESKTVVTASGARTAVFNGTQANITVS